MKAKKYPPLGSVSSGTMRSEDLIPAFFYSLEEYAPDAAAELVNDYPEFLSADALPDYESGQADYLLEALFAALNDCAPPYATFGANEGDGADYGFWVCWESLEEDCHGGDILKVDAGGEWPQPLPEGTEYVVEVTDHGNATLFTAAGEEVWSCV